MQDPRKNLIDWNKAWTFRHIPFKSHKLEILAALLIPTFYILKEREAVNARAKEDSLPRVSYSLSGSTNFAPATRLKPFQKPTGSIRQRFLYAFSDAYTTSVGIPSARHINMEHLDNGLPIFNYDAGYYPLGCCKDCYILNRALNFIEESSDFVNSQNGFQTAQSRLVNRYNDFPWREFGNIYANLVTDVSNATDLDTILFTKNSHIFHGRKFFMPFLASGQVIKNACDRLEDMKEKNIPLEAQPEYLKVQKLLVENRVLFEACIHWYVEHLLYEEREYSRARKLSKDVNTRNWDREFIYSPTRESELEKYFIEDSK